MRWYALSIQNEKAQPTIYLQEFSGKWILEPDPSVRDGQSLATILKYEATIVPHWNLPSTLVAAVIRCGLPANLQAIVKRAEQVHR